MLSAADADRFDTWLERIARTLGGQDDDRTLNQKRADLVADVLLGRRRLDSTPTGRTTAGAVIGITWETSDRAPGRTRARLGC